MLFSELYGAYYNTVAAILKEAVKRPVSERKIREIVQRHAFDESIVTIPDALKEQRWQLLKADGTTPIQHTPGMPLTTLQKQWLKAVSCDPRIRLFGDVDFGLENIEPLFLPSDVIVFDKYTDGDDFTDETYIRNFRMIGKAIKEKTPLRIETKNRKGETVSANILPQFLEYSEKDDKFRLIGATDVIGNTINLGRILRLEPCEISMEMRRIKRNAPRPRKVIFELTNERKALERVLLHFTHFEKTAERMDNNKYRITVHYEKEDETEVVIRMLSFGPMVRVVAPQHFIDLIVKRLKEQQSCEI
ncbi:MAG: WYL domain-containing protein [Erysipelotrichaceae bacterium]|nr:WYL domain-containing protein [Erysipelotrichaceae bacterium]